MADLFEHGKTGLNHPIKFVYIEGGNVGEYPASVAFSVSKKKFRKAVDRNLLKRRMREAYRLNKSLFYTKLKDKTVKVMFIYVADQILSYSIIEKAVKQVLNRLA